MNKSNSSNTMYVDVIMPLALEGKVTYRVPKELSGEILVGQLVEVNLGRRKLYASLVVEIHYKRPENLNVKNVISIIEIVPIITSTQLKFWNWISEYYSCTLGEVMTAALPSKFKLSSSTRIVLRDLFDIDDISDDLNDDEYLIVEALEIHKELSMDEVQKILGRKTIYPNISSLIAKEIIFLKEQIKRKFVEKRVPYVRLQQKYRENNTLLNEVFNRKKRAYKQTEALLAFMVLNSDFEHVLKSELQKKAKINSSVIKALEKDGVFEIYTKVHSRIDSFGIEQLNNHTLSDIQKEAYNSINALFESKNTVLLHGITGSGKTNIYEKLINDAVEKQKQVLILLPEVALTEHIIDRLKFTFGDKIIAYHHKVNDNERVEIWRRVASGQEIIIGPRSSIWLPFENLGLVIIDEEHDSSYKQVNPAPRFQGRDAAIYLAYLYSAKTVLGSATPSIESYYNAKNGKYGLVTLDQRYGESTLPNVEIVPVLKSNTQISEQTHLTKDLVASLKQVINQGYQAIIFQNRRGYAPTYQCHDCGWTQECGQCDVTMTYHRRRSNLQCHYCGEQRKLVKNCPSCSSKDLRILGFGTEKIEDDLKTILPEVSISRMDFDTVKNKNGHARLLHDFEEKVIDVLVGTQMVTKGLDFENVNLVAVISADQLLYFPDFRANERGFQLMTQVAGRAGRRKVKGKVMIQAINHRHHVLPHVVGHNYSNFFEEEIVQRKDFLYPPFSKLIIVTLRHTKFETLNVASKILEGWMKNRFKKYVDGPINPNVGRIRNYYIQEFLIKIPHKTINPKDVKSFLRKAKVHLKQQIGLSSVKVQFNVDP